MCTFQRRICRFAAIRGWVQLALVTGWLSCASAYRGSDDAETWWQHVAYLASDELQGRETGSKGHEKAAHYVAKKFDDLGLQAAGSRGYFQPVEFEARKVDETESSVELVVGGESRPLKFGDQVVLGVDGVSGRMIDAPLVFVGYGATVPEHNYDDYAGLEISGKVRVRIGGAPKEVPGLLAAHYQSSQEVKKNVERLGVAGSVTIPNPRLMEVPWSRFAASRHDSQMDLADKALGTWLKTPFLFLNPDAMDVLFQGSGHTKEEVLKMDRAGAQLPKFPLPARIRAKVTYRTSRVWSSNVVALLPSTESGGSGEYVLLSAHLDHVGVGAPVDGDRIHNGAMDNASGVASLLEVARQLKSPAVPLKRNILFLACTGEEKGLLGSEYFAEHPTVPMNKVVANVNLDMFLPLFPLEVVRGYGVGESNLAHYLEQAAAEQALKVQDDPNPERNIFIRSDQYSFIRKGVPALFLSFGYEKDSPEEKTVTEWFYKRYHSPSDDTLQPLNRQAAAEFNRLLAATIMRIANAPVRPEWNRNSFFRRFTSNYTEQQKSHR